MSTENVFFVLAGYPVRWQELVLGLVLLLALLVAGFRYWRWYSSTPQRIRRALKEISHDMMEDFFLADGLGGHIHIDVLLLTNRGLLVLDLKDVEGAVFGADHMDEWVLIAGNRRHGFPNPLYALHDRIATVRMHAKDTHAEGYVVFTESARFEKGVPSETVVLDHLVETVGPAGDDYPQAFSDSWRALRNLAEQAQEETRPPA
ncbi:MAG: nuclease-related domain-containing protein [Gammaproteobacteria bacterium]|nr:nuclease-related domain-containing protein [Gammaproteobacteria bacterium]